MSLIDAMQDTKARTANGARTNSTSKNKVLDLFFLMGASRGEDITQAVLKAAEEDPELTAKVLLWGRDVRGGAGERQLFRSNLMNLPDAVLVKVIPKIPEVGRWDDLLVLSGTKHEALALDLIRQALNQENSLCAKWMPRPNKALCKANDLWRKLGFLSPGAYRRRLAHLTRVVETPMCKKEWASIDFERITSLNHKRYASAFERNAPHYAEYVSRLNSGDAKVNTGAVYPYDVIQLLKSNGEGVANPMWANLPDYLGDTSERILPLVDVSGSMHCPAGNSASLSCMDVAISLGLYISERTKGPFKDAFMTFSSSPTIEVAKGTLKQRYQAMHRAHWGGSTDLQANFKLLLKTAVAKKMKQKDMPTMLLILSDMEFDSYSVRGKDLTALKGIKAMYKEAGYKMPKLVFWNLNGREGNVPVRAHSKNVAAVSGFSPSIMTSLLSGKDFTPMSIMLETLNNPRYSLS